MRRLLPLLLLLATLGPIGCRTSQPVTVVNARAELDDQTLWTLSSMRQKNVGPETGQPTVQMLINLESGIATGSTGCNRMSCHVALHDEGGISFQDISISKMGCADEWMQFERNFIALLRRVDGFTMDAFTLRLTQKGTTLLTFERVETDETND